MQNLRKKIFATLLLLLFTLVIPTKIFGSFTNDFLGFQIPIISDLFSNTEEIKVTPYVSATGTKLYVNGEIYQFTGVNAFYLGTYAGVNAGCGSQVNDLDAFFSKLRPNSAVRMWAYQGSVTTNVKTKQIDWTGLDRVVDAAQKNGIKLILVLGEQSGTCDDGHWKDKSWYEGGYKQAFNDYGNGLTPLPYLDYVKLVVSRYKDSTAIAMWEPINEATASDCLNGKGSACYANQTCSDEPAAAKALRSFFDTVGGQIKSIDNNHLVSSGVIGDGQCGAIYEDYKYIHGSPGIDVASYHDYGRDDQPMPGDPWNGLQKRLDQMKLINKPLIIGEIGMLATENTLDCMNYSSREDKVKAKMDAQFKAGIMGFMPWALTVGSSTICNFSISLNDPVMSLLHDYPVSMSTFTPPLSVTPYLKSTPTPDIEPPTIPKNLQTIIVSPTQVTLTWDVSTDNVGVVRYDLFRNNYYLTSTSSASFTDINLDPYTTYVYHVKGKDAAGNISGSSNKVTIPYPTSTPYPSPTRLPDTQAPTVPTNLVGTDISSTQVTLNWVESTDNFEVVRYDIFRDSIYIGSTSGTSFINTNLTPFTTYIYHVKSKDAAGNISGSSNKVKVTTISL